MADRWGFIRKGSDAKAYSDYLKAGIGGALLNASDPYFAEGWAGAGSAGMHRGIWAPAANGADPIAYARSLAALSSKYHPELLVPNIEFIGKGTKGSAGWDWSEKMMAEFRRLSPQQKLAVSVMGNQDDFNYEAYTNRGSDVWSQAYDDKMRPYNADAMYDQLVRRGVDPNRINITLGPGGAVGSRSQNYSAYALDDFNSPQLSGLGFGRPTPARTTSSASPTTDQRSRLVQTLAGGASPRNLAELQEWSKYWATQGRR